MIRHRGALTGEHQRQANHPNSPAMPCFGGLTLPSSGRLVCVAILAVLVVALDVGSALACRCKEPSAKAAFRSADSVILGQIVSAEKDEGESDGIAYRVQVDEWWKEKVDLSILVHSSTTCRFEAESGKRYVIFLKRNLEGKLETAMCMGNLAEKRAGSLLEFLRGTHQRHR